VLAARRADALEVTASLRHQSEGMVLIVRTDVTQNAQVEALVQAAVSAHGRIDVWVNNAGVTLLLCSNRPVRGASARHRDEFVWRNAQRAQP
jgi:NADP-dependent 3-hydroxy acid dehydrogenase YdfG